MKTANLPPVRITPELREQLDGVLHEGESLSSFVNDAVRQHIVQRQADQSFVARAWSAHERLQQGGAFETPETLMKDLRARHAAAKRRAK
jgi:Arc/MetJ-type ribon-helix-helix transcriptional regulator